jgi:type I restriction enzyme S subunit
MNAPKLRFKEFNDEWISQKLFQLVEFSKGNILAKADLDETGNYPCILYGQLYTKYNEVIREVYSKTNRNENNIPKSKKGDVLIPSSGETPIDISTSSCIQIDNVLLGGDINILRPISCDGRFLSYLINNNKKTEIAKVAQGHSVVHLYNDNLKQISINIPSVQEQKRISDTLELLDKKIELQSKKIEDLKLFKLYMENQFIFKDDASYIEYKLRDILIEGNKTPVVDTSKYQKLTIKLNLKGLEFNESQKEMSDKRPFYVRDENELIIGKQNYFNGSIAIVDKKYAGGICSNAIMSFKAKDGFDIKYIYLYLSQKSYMKQREFLANGTGQKELSEKEFLNFSIRIPSDNKVKKIIKNVNCISKKILLEKNKLNKLIELKRGLMQNMFV